MSDAYTTALIASREAFAKFDAARKAYRARQIGDAEFLAAKAEYAESEKAFDIAFSAEQTAA
jgi:head-tail adaptor